MRDNGGQPTSGASMKAWSTLGVTRLSPALTTRKATPTPTAQRTLKAECLWLQAWTCPLEWFEALTRWIKQYNRHNWPSALGYKPPKPFGREYYSSHGTPWPSA
jgi:hypothetical protein